MAGIAVVLRVVFASGAVRHKRSRLATGACASRVTFRMPLLVRLAGSENGMAMEEVITLFLGVLSLQYGTDVAETVPVSGLYRRIEVNS